MLLSAFGIKSQIFTMAHISLQGRSHASLALYHLSILGGVHVTLTFPQLPQAPYSLVPMSLLCLKGLQLSLLSRLDPSEDVLHPVSSHRPTSTSCNFASVL